MDYQKLEEMEQELHDLIQDGKDRMTTRFEDFKLWVTRHRFWIIAGLTFLLLLSWVTTALTQ